MSAKGILCILLFVILLSVTGCNVTEPEQELANPVTGSDHHSRDLAQLEEQEQTQLTIIKQIWDGIYDQSQTGANCRRFRAAGFRTKGLIMGLLAYWDIHDTLPACETGLELIDILEQEKLMPFRAVDPETGGPVEIVAGVDQILQYEDLYIEYSPDGIFKITLLIYPGASFSPTLDQYDAANVISGLSHYTSITSGPDNERKTVELPTAPASVFKGLMWDFFKEMVTESFIVNGKKVPLTLEELLCGRVIINPDGWGHPAGHALSPGELGNFEFGVDPFIDAYYQDYTTSEGERFFWTVRFVETEVSGELVYNLTSDNAMVTGAAERELTNKIPLLTDELFAGPPPEI